MPIYVETHSENVPTGYRVLLASAYGYRVNLFFEKFLILW
jgi:hypothetical protein